MGENIKAEKCSSGIMSSYKHFVCMPVNRGKKALHVDEVFWRLIALFVFTLLSSCTEYLNN